VLIARTENFFEQRKFKKDYTLWKNKGLIAVAIYFGVSLPCQLIMAILHMIDPLTRVAFDTFPTMLFFLAKCGLYGANIFIQGPLIETVLKGHHELKDLIRLNYAFGFCISVCSIVVGSFAFITYDYYEDNLPEQIMVMRAYYYVQALALIINGAQAYMVKRWVFQALDAAQAIVSSQDKTRMIKQKIGSYQGGVIVQGTLQGIIYIVMGSVPFFLNKHQYFLPMSWLAMPILGKRLAFQFDLDKAGNKTIAKRLGLKKGSTNDSSTNNSSKAKRQNKNGGEVTAQNTTDNPSFVYHQTDHGSFQELQNESAEFNGKKGKRGKKDGMVLSIAISDEESGMQEILDMDNTELKFKFTEFVRQQHASENLQVYDACMKYQTEVQSGVMTDKAREMARAIINDFVNQDSNQAIDMASALRESLLAKAAKDEFAPDTFEPLKSMVYNLMKANFYRAFAKSLLQ